MYTEGVAPSKWLPALARPSKALPLQKKRSGGISQDHPGWLPELEAAVTRTVFFLGAGAGPHRRRLGVGEMEVGPRSASSMSSRQPSRSMSRSTWPNRSRVALCRGVRWRHAASML